MFRKKVKRVPILLFLFSFVMSSVSTDHSSSNQSLQYDSIFEHYGFEERVPYMYDENSFETRGRVLERNYNNQVKKINAKTVTKTQKKKTVKHAPGKSKHHPHHKSPVCPDDDLMLKVSTFLFQLKKKGHDKVIKIPVPPTAKSRKASYTYDTLEQTF